MANHLFWFTLVITLVTINFDLTQSTSALNKKVYNGENTFRNPIIDLQFEPYVYHHTDGFYYMAHPVENNTAISILKSYSLIDWSGANETTVYVLQPPFVHLDDPELHFIDGDWYIYFILRLETDGRIPRNYVIKAKNSDDPLGDYEHAIKLSPLDADGFSHDGTVLEYEDGLYFVWSGYPNASISLFHLYIAAMYSPTEISGSRMLLRSPDKEWKAGGVSSPQVLQKNGRTFIVYTAYMGNGDLCLGLIWIDYGRHALLAENWVDSVNNCVFWTYEEQQVFRVACPSFTTSPDGLEDWMLYTASDLNSTTKRIIRANRFGWDKDGMPVFPRPGGYSIDLKVPSGER